MRALLKGALVSVLSLFIALRLYKPVPFFTSNCSVSEQKTPNSFFYVLTSFSHSLSTVPPVLISRSILALEGVNIIKSKLSRFLGKKNDGTRFFKWIEWPGIMNCLLSEFHFSFGGLFFFFFSLLTKAAPSLVPPHFKSQK